MFGGISGSIMRASLCVFDSYHKNTMDVVITAPACHAIHTLMGPANILLVSAPCCQSWVFDQTWTQPNVHRIRANWIAWGCLCDCGQQCTEPTSDSFRRVRHIKQTHTGVMGLGSQAPTSLRPCATGSHHDSQGKGTQDHQHHQGSVRHWCFASCVNAPLPLLPCL